MAAGRVCLENNTVIHLKFDSVNATSQAPRRIGSKEKPEFADAPQYGGVSYITEGHNQPPAKWIVAWRVTQNKVFSKIIQANQAFNWSDINDELDEYGEATYTDCPVVLGLKSEVKIVQRNESTRISASLSKA